MVQHSLAEVQIRGPGHWVRGRIKVPVPFSDSPAGKLLESQGFSQKWLAPVAPLRPHILYGVDPYTPPPLPCQQGLLSLLDTLHEAADLSRLFSSLPLKGSRELGAGAGSGVAWGHRSDEIEAVLWIADVRRSPRSGHIYT
ncbi:hypothetical protein VTG60DRAFT_1926 [Thermothelomyces hinnuleus]